MTIIVKEEECARRDNHVLGCNLAKYSPTFLIFFTDKVVGATENARPENAGLENDGQLRKE